MKNNPKELIDDLKVIRTIHSNQFRKFANYNNAYLVITIIVAVIISFIGFSGIDNLSKLIGSNENPYNKDIIQFIMNLMTLLILVITVLGLIFKFERKTSKSYNAIVNLTEFISDVEFTYLSDNSTEKTFKSEDLPLYSHKYKSLINSLPPTKDSHYYKALKTIKKKKKIKKFIESEEYDKKNKIERLIYLFKL
jgi:ABC-type multidrug transport system fused ATPase/permease subunit